MGILYNLLTLLLLCLGPLNTLLYLLDHNRLLLLLLILQGSSFIFFFDELLLISFLLKNFIFKTYMQLLRRIANVFLFSSILLTKTQLNLEFLTLNDLLFSFNLLFLRTSLFGPFDGESRLFFNDFFWFRRFLLLLLLIDLSRWRHLSLAHTFTKPSIWLGLRVQIICSLLVLPREHLLQFLGIFHISYFLLDFSRLLILSLLLRIL